MSVKVPLRRVKIESIPVHGAEPATGWEMVHGHDVAALEADYQRAMKVVEAARVALREFERGEEK